jgi:tight adherence protein B
LQRRRAAHVRKLEEQVDSLILGLANSLKTVPSPSAALSQLVPVLPDPMRLEVDRLLREMRVGSTLEQALLNMSSRLKSPDLDTALSAVLIGLQVGGNLPLVLENTAAAIREMNRLQGVVRTKTSEARAQLWVLALFPFVICFAFNSLDPDYLAPLQTTFIGTLLSAVALVLWLVSLLSARKILKVDI